MKRYQTILPLAALLTACSQDLGIGPDLHITGSTADGQGRVALVITSGIGIGVDRTTRAAGVSWAEGDAIGVYVTPAGSTDSAIDGGNNKQYTTTVTTPTSTGAAGSASYTPAAFKVAAGVEPIYLPANDAAVDVYGYYPFTPDGATTPTNPRAIPVSVASQTSQSAIDFMRAKATTTTIGGTTTIKKSTPEAALLFHHKLSRVVFNLVAGTGLSASDLTGTAERPVTTALTIGGQPTTGTYDIYGDVLAMPLQDVATLTAKTVSNGQQYEAILLPNTDAGGTALANNAPTERTCSLAVTSSSYTLNYTFKIPADKVFAPGQQTTYTVTVNSKGVIVTAAIEPWAAQPAVDLTAQ